MVFQIRGSKKAIVMILSSTAWLSTPIDTICMFNLNSLQEHSQYIDPKSQYIDTKD